MSTCLKCGKTIVSPEDWGDYDDACEWACTCPVDHAKLSAKMSASKASKLIQELKIALGASPETVEMCLIKVYRNQTQDEQSTQETKEHNSVGFTAFDAKKLTYYAQYVLSGKHLSGSHLENASQKMKKYARQLVSQVMC
jgi:hypothetical protein